MTRLELLLADALRADPTDRLIAPMGEHDYATLFGCVSADFAVLKIAAQVEPCADNILAWYTSEGIRELGDFTPQALVAMGRAELVLRFLLSIMERERG